MIAKNIFFIFTLISSFKEVLLVFSKHSIHCLQHLWAKHTELGTRYLKSSGAAAIWQKSSGAVAT